MSCGAVHFLAPVRRSGMLVWVSLFVLLFPQPRALATEAAVASADRMMLGGWNPEFQGFEGYALRRVLSIRDLPSRVTFKPGEISLVADPADRRGEYMVVYLINDTDHPIPEVIGELHKARTQVRVGAFWLSDEEHIEHCCSVPMPKDLPSRNALALGAWHSTSGDSKGQRRFVFDLNNRRSTSEPIPGVFSMANVEAALNRQVSGILIDDMRNRLFPNHWGESGVARTPEEFVAMLELVRSQGQFVAQRRELMNWVLQRKEKRDASPEIARAIDGIVEILEKPWLVNNDHQSLTIRSLAALRGSGSNGYGTPEKCRTLVWRYLSSPRLEVGPECFRSEYQAPDEDSLAALGQMAAKVMKESKSPDEIEAVGRFLNSHWLAERHFSSDSFREYLQTGEINHIRTGLAGLALRGMAEESGLWLSKHFTELGADAAVCYAEVSRCHVGATKEWEYPVIGFLLESYPSESIAVSENRLRSVDRHRVPEAWVASLRHFLRNELSAERKAWWIKRRNESKCDSSRFAQRGMLDSVESGIWLLDRWGNVSDRAIIRSFLDHPAAVFQKTGQGVGKLSFRLRIVAKNILVLRHEPLPVNVIEEKLAITADQTPEPSMAFMFIKENSRNMMAFLLGSLLASLIWWIKGGKKRNVM